MRLKDTEKMPPIDKVMYLIGFGFVQTIETTIMAAALPAQYLQGAIQNALDKHRGEPTSRTKNRRLRNAVSFGQAHLAQRAIDKGGNIDHTMGFSEQTLLGFAAACGYLKIATALLDAGAQIDLARKDDGVTPLISAVRNNQLKSVELLLERGASLEASANDGTTPLIAAADLGLTALVQLLLDKGAKPQAQRNGQTACDIAVEKGYDDIASLSKPFNNKAAPATTEKAITVAAPIVLKQPRP